MAPKLKFSEGEKVLCFHGPLIYEAKCLKTMLTKDKQHKYFIHYAGWNKNWDEWVPETRVLKYNEANLLKQKEVQETHSTQNSTPKSKKLKSKKTDSSSDSTTQSNSGSTTQKLPSTASSSGTDSGSDATKKKKRLRVEPKVENKSQSDIEAKLKIPDELKPWLVDDWDIISRQRKLLNLPARVTVEQIINDYLAYKKSVKTSNTYRESNCLEVCSALKEYFNVMLGSQLLYKFERPQYAQILCENQDVPACQLYGGIHLLRLFVKLRGMLAYTALDEKSTQLLITNVQDIYKYMISNISSILSLQDYTSALPEYLRQAQ